MPLREYRVLCWSQTRTTWLNLRQFLPAQEEFSANVCVCKACLPQLEIAADHNLKTVYFFSPSKSYSALIIGIQILLSGNDGKETWIAFGLLNPDERGVGWE